MRLVLLLTYILISLCANGSSDEPSPQSPNGKYELLLTHPEGKSSILQIVDRSSNKVLWGFDFESVGMKKVSSISFSWSPDSQHIGISIPSGQIVGTLIIRIDKTQSKKVELLAIPSKFDVKVSTHRGGEYLDHWEDSNTFWTSDSSKNRSFRYSLTKGNKFLVNKYEDYPTDAKLDTTKIIKPTKEQEKAR